MYYKRRDRISAALVVGEHGAQRNMFEDFTYFDNMVIGEVHMRHSMLVSPTVRRLTNDVVTTEFKFSGLELTFYTDDPEGLAHVFYLAAMRMEELAAEDEWVNEALR